jgi:hypothetical protein
MRYQTSLSLLLAALWGSDSYGSVSEAEPNSTVRTNDVRLCGFPLNPDGTCNDSSLYWYTTEVDDITGNVNPNANLDPTRANKLKLDDETVGQLGSTRDYDWFYVDSDGARPITPVYFGCDRKLGYYYESPDKLTIDPDKDISYQINYYYAPAGGTAEGLELQSSYVVYPATCKLGTAETIGHMRFQMNTERPGRYYVRVWGRQIGVVDKSEQVTLPDGSTATWHKFYDQIVTPTADYSLRVYTSRVPGHQEPNDGTVEAFPLISGKATTGQLSSMYDQDWYAVYNDVSLNTSKKIPFYFTCKGQTGSSYTLSAYDYLGVLQVNYEISASQCSGAGGFSFTIDAPISATYYFVVNSPTYTETAQFTQSDYTVLAITQPNSGSSETPTRLPGDLEPNDTLINAYPLTNEQAVIGQLSAITDLDYYYYDNDSGQNPLGTVPIYFGCDLPDTSSAVYSLAYYNAQGVLQNSYTVNAAACSIQPKTTTDGTVVPATGGFSFKMNTPATGRYYILVAGPANGEGDVFSDADYTLSTFLDAASQIPASNGANLKKAKIADSNAANRDSFTINLNNCGQKGTIKLTGKKLNLKGVDQNSQVVVQIGQWSCVSGPKTLNIDKSDSARTLYFYPKPAPAPQPQPRPNQATVTN